MLIRFFYEGDPRFMSLVYLMWIIVFILAIRFLILYRSNKNPQKLKRTNDSIMFTGSLAFLVGITGQMFGLIGAFDNAQSMPGIDLHYIAGGFKVTFIVSFFGIALLMISSIFWFLFRSLKKYPSQTKSKIK